MIWTSVARILLPAILLSILPAAGAAQSPESSEERPRVMILGSLHLANPGADDTDVEADDPRFDRRQRGLEVLAERLARFRPDRIAVELPAAYADSRARGSSGSSSSPGAAAYAGRARARGR
jgi:hypothetical protein